MPSFSFVVLVTTDVEVFEDVYRVECSCITQKRRRFWSAALCIDFT